MRGYDATRNEKRRRKIRNKVGVRDLGYFYPLCFTLTSSLLSLFKKKAKKIP